MFTPFSKKKSTFYEIEDIKNLKVKNERIEENKNYIPKKKRLGWCFKYNKKMVPQFRCFSYGKNSEKCPFFGYTDAEKSDYNYLNKKYKY